ncbi:2-C-methyl-D-erythritol 4-phosphate cytidylyltransferase [Leeia oryzae]|uniref:2-C-methyl-D-erythritol 4-phosphate cytidylyltransferase n=1 Tax=Leeia oryzae TaxID=356662 RepID=UPI00036317B3|nr:2-C-methyl-D-erythritol 4-phosphate cytidylyltransferase [Leeia oryzae]
MKTGTRFVGLVPAAGVGSRMNADRPKQYLLVKQHPVLWHTVNALLADRRIEQVVVVIAPDDPWFDRFDWSGLPGMQVVRCGGASRAESVRNGLRYLANDYASSDWVLVHDAARPCLGYDHLKSLMDTLHQHDVGGILAVPVPDTVKQSRDGVLISATVPRADLWLAQTPQMFHLGMLSAAHAGDLSAITDEASAMEQAGFVPALVLGSRNNLKVTFPEDLQVVEALLT